MIESTKKIWGYEDRLIDTNKYCSKYLHVSRRYQSSLHYHMVKDETLYIMSGAIELESVELTSISCLPLDTNLKVHDSIIGCKDNFIKNIEVTTLRHGDSFRLEPFVAHRFKSLTSSSVLLEVSSAYPYGDTYRIEASRKLKPNEYDLGYF